MIEIRNFTNYDMNNWGLCSRIISSCSQVASLKACLFQEIRINGIVLFFRVLTLLSRMAIGCSVYDKFGCSFNSEWSRMWLSSLTYFLSCDMWIHCAPLLVMAVMRINKLCLPHDRESRTGQCISDRYREYLIGSLSWSEIFSRIHVYLLWTAFC